MNDKGAVWPCAPRVPGTGRRMRQRICLLLLLATLLCGCGQRSEDHSRPRAANTTKRHSESVPADSVSIPDAESTAPSPERMSLIPDGFGVLPGKDDLGQPEESAAASSAEQTESQNRDNAEESWEGTKTPGGLATDPSHAPIEGNSPVPAPRASKSASLPSFAGNPLRHSVTGSGAAANLWTETGTERTNPLRMDLRASSPMTKRGTEATEKSFGNANELSPPASTPASQPSSTDHAASNRSRFALPLPAEELLPDSDRLLDESSSAAMLMPPELGTAAEPAFEADRKMDAEGIGPSISEAYPSDAATEGPAIQPLLSTDDGPSANTEEPSEPVTVPGNESQDRPTGTVVSPSKSAAKNDTNMVRVFYGTNRSPITSVANKTAIPVVLGGVLSVTSLVGAIIFYARSRRWTWACGTVGLCSLILLVLGLFRMVSPAANSLAVRGYGSERGAVKYGYCDISLPPQHEFGEIERPSVFRLELREREDRHVVIKRIEEQTSKLFFAALKERVQESSQRDMFVFVHGYNVTFDNAARRTAQMAHDLGFEGAPVFFSWPSQGEFSDYTVDENTVAWTVPHLKEFLLEVVRQSDASRIHLIAHSMGNRAMTAAIRGLRQEFPHHPKFFQEIVLAAPDIDAEEFRNQIAPAIVPAAERVTLYASSNDHALMASRLIHGFSRAGESGDNLIIVPGIDTIDVSRVDQSLLGHSYYGGSGPVLQDMRAILNGVSASSGRPWLLADEQNQLTYYRLDPAEGLARRPN